jgi:phage tail tube protein FII
MGGWFVDIIVEYIYRVVARAIRMRGITHWPIAKGKVNDSACPPVVYGCDVAAVYYEYHHNGEIYTGIDEKPFLFQISGKDYLERFPRDTEIVVRLRPEDPSVSFLREGDQTLTP